MIQFCLVHVIYCANPKQAAGAGYCFSEARVEKFGKCGIYDNNGVLCCRLGGNKMDQTREDGKACPHFPGAGDVVPGARGVVPRAGRSFRHQTRGATPRVLGRQLPLPPPPTPHPSSAWTRRREVKQGKSGGSVGTTDQGKGKGRSVVRPMGTVAYRGKGQGKGKGRGEGRLGQGGRGRSKGGEKLMGTTAYGGKGSKGRAANGDRPVGAASCKRDHHTMASCQNPPPQGASDQQLVVKGMNSRSQWAPLADGATLTRRARAGHLF